MNETVSSLGEGGCFVATDEPLESDSIVLLDISFDDGFLLSVRGQVVWTRHPDQRSGGGMAVRFEHLEVMQKTALYKLIDRIVYQAFVEKREMPHSARGRALDPGPGSPLGSQA